MDHHNEMQKVHTGLEDNEVVNVKDKKNVLQHDPTREDVTEIPMDATDQDQLNLSPRLDLMTRWLDLCRNIPCMGIILAFLSSIFTSITSLSVKLVQVNPLVVVIFQ